MASTTASVPAPAQAPTQAQATAIEEKKAAADHKLGAPKLDQPQLQAGGGSASATSKARTVNYLSPTFAKYLKTIYDEVEKKYKLTTKEGLARWLVEEQ